MLTKLTILSIYGRYDPLTFHKQGVFIILRLYLLYLTVVMSVNCKKSIFDNIHIDKFFCHFTAK